MTLIRVRVPAWDDAARKTCEVFRLRLRDSSRLAVCTEAEHDLGWELRIVIAGELRQSTVCRTKREAAALAEEWLRKMSERGWQRVDEES